MLCLTQDKVNQDLLFLKKYLFAIYNCKHLFQIGSLTNVCGDNVA